MGRGKNALGVFDAEHNWSQTRVPGILSFINQNECARWTVSQPPRPFTATVSPRFPETVKLRQRADEQTIPRHRRCGHAHFIERVLVQKAVLRTGLENERVSENKMGSPRLRSAE